MKIDRLYYGKIPAALFGLAIFASTPAIAQEEEQVFELSPFEVDASGDMGYVATSTLTGSRLNTRLEDVASSVTVFTEEFLNDTGLTSLEEIIQYSVGSVNDIQDINAGPDINNFLGAANPVERVRSRGIRATKGLDYFQAYTPDDSYRVGRYDESRGPNGILFGISEAGGIINSTTLRADTIKDSGRLRYSTGSYDRSRFEGRYNKVLIPEKLGITLAGMTQDNGGWREYERDKRDSIYGAIKWEPTKRLTLQAMGESGHYWATRIRPYNATDRFLAWYLNRERFGVGAVTFTPGSGSGRNGNNPSTSQHTVLGVDNNNVGRTTAGQPSGRYVYVANDQTWFNSAGMWESASFEDPDVATFEDTLAATSVQDIIAAGRSRVGYEDPAKIINYEQYGFPYPTRLNAGGPDMWRAEDFNTYTFMGDYRIANNLFINFAYNHQENEITAQFDDASRPEITGDPNKVLRHHTIAQAYGLPIDEPNPYVGQLYFESQWRYQTHSIDYDEARAAISYDVDLNDYDLSWLGRHRLAAGWAYREMSDQLLGQRYGFLGNPFDTADPTDFDDNRNRIYVRSYLTEGDFSTYRIDAPPTKPRETGTTVTDDGITRPIGYINENGGTLNARSDIEVTSYILAMQNYLWNDRIVTTLGWREDEAKNTAFGHVLDPLFGDTLTTDKTVDGYRKDDPISANTKTAGVVFHLTDNFSLLANYATSIGLPEFRNIVFPNRGIAPPVEGEGYDVGIAFNFFEDRISGRLVYFDVEAINRTSSGGGTRIISDPMRDSMRALNEIREFDNSIIRKSDGNPYSDSEWEAEINALNGASGEGLSPSGQVNSFLQDEYSEGWELSLVANITDNWRLTLNTSYTDRILLNYGREFARSAGFQEDDNGRYIQAVTVDSGEAEALAVDPSKLTEGSIHQRILEIAQNAVGTITYTDSTGNLQSTTFDGTNGALLINTDDSFTPVADLNTDESIAYRLWESQDQLQLEVDQREKRWGLSPWKFNVFTAYDFKEGMLDGFTLGGGYRWNSGTIIGEDREGREMKSPSEGYWDLLLRYTQRLKKGKRLEYQINVYNLFDQDDPLPVRHVILDDPTSPLSRNKLIDPMTVRATITYSF